MDVWLLDGCWMEGGSIDGWIGDWMDGGLAD